MTEIDKMSGERRLMLEVKKQIFEKDSLERGVKDMMLDLRI